jgi:hypothetical protein
MLTRPTLAEGTDGSRATPMSDFHATKVLSCMPMIPEKRMGRHMMFCLADKFRLTAGSWKTRSFAAGDCLLMERKRHITEVTSRRPVTLVMIRLA